MEVTEIIRKSWVLTNVSPRTYQKDVFDFMKSLNCACHVVKGDYMATTPLTMKFEIEQDF